MSHYATRSVQIAAKIQAAAGTAETLAAADVKLRPEELEYTHDPNRFENNELREDIGKQADFISGLKGSMRAGFVLKGSGAVGTAPAIGLYLRACGHKEELVNTVTTGALSGGSSFPEGAAYSATGGKAGIIEQEYSGGGTLRYIATSGGEISNTDTITVGAVTATASADSDTYGYRYTPRTAGQEFITLQRFIGPSGANAPRFARLRSVMCDGSLGWTVHDVGRAKFDFMGVKDAHGEASMFTGFTLEEAAGADIAKLINAVVQINAQTVVPGAISLAFGNQVDMDPDPTAAGGGAEGYDQARILNRQPQITIDPRMVEVSVLNELALLEAGTLIPFHFVSSGSAGHIIEILAESCQIQGLTEGDRADLKTNNLTLIPTSRSVLDTAYKIYFR